MRLLSLCKGAEAELGSMKTSNWERIAILGLIGGIFYVLYRFVADSTEGIPLAIISIPVYYSIYRLLCRRVYLGAGILCINAVMFVYLVVLASFDPSKIAFNSTLPDSVFQPSIISKALCAVYLFSAVMAVHLLLCGPRKWDLPKPSVAETAFIKRAVVWGLLGSLGLHLIVVRAPLITRAAYFSQKFTMLTRGTGERDLTLQLLGVFLLAFSLVSSVIAFGWKSRYSKISLYGSLFIVTYFYLLRGNRGIVLGFGSLLCVLMLATTKGRFKFLIVGGSVILLYLLLQIWASVRWEAEKMGLWNAVVYCTSTFKEQIADKKNVMAIQRLPQLTWNLFDVVNLYESGIRRDGETYLNLIPQAIPRSIADTFGYERPLAEPWILAKYVVHGGAINPLAEAYWNFGMWGSIVVASVLSWILIGLERCFRNRSIIYTPLYFAGILVLPGSYMIGTQAFVRAVEAVVLMTIGVSIAYRVFMEESESGCVRTSTEAITGIVRRSHSLG
jgi:hypothetical protein